jgi:hypothetical protein|eukprot:COSAG06_NODE_102_length_23983_cov_152.911363_19_plen_90_part_00
MRNELSRFFVLACPHPKPGGGDGEGGRSSTSRKAARAERCKPNDVMSTIKSASNTVCCRCYPVPCCCRSCCFRRNSSFRFASMACRDGR